MSQNLTVTSVVDANNNLSFQDANTGAQNLILKASGVSEYPNGSVQVLDTGAVINDAGNSAFQVRGVSIAALEMICVEFVATLAQINAGLALFAGAPGMTLSVESVWLKVLGNFATLTDIRISDTAGAPVDAVTVAVAGLTNGAVILADGLPANVTLGTFATPLTPGKGLQIRKTGSAGTGGTSVSGRVFLRLI